MVKMLASVVAMVIIITAIVVYTVKNSTATKNEKAVEPVNINMELVCVTPHGHGVYRYRDQYLAGVNPNYIYVLIRHSDGYVISLSVVTKP